jgi:hypothetical protein
MRFEIGKPIKTRNPKNKYLIIAEAMHGDADKYEKVEIGPFSKSQIKEIEAIINLFKKMKKYDCDPNGYYNIEGFEEFYSDCWPSDCTCCDYPASFKSYEIFFFDENGIKYQVKVIEN